MMTKAALIESCLRLYHSCPGNDIEVPDLGMLKLFEEPLVGFASAADPLFEQYKSRDVIGDLFLSPTEWLPGAGTVVSIFFPIAEDIRKSNTENKKLPSMQWLYARIEGQQFITAYIMKLQKHLTEKGLQTCVPSLDARFGMRADHISAQPEDIRFNTRWSERHAAYACGLGTFGLSRGLITEKGTAGRITSIIIDEVLKPTQRSYTGTYDNCIFCGACAANCPVRAITPEHGKNNIKCNRYVEAMKKKYAPRYGCGKCQTGVPCECRIPDSPRHTL